MAGGAPSSKPTGFLKPFDLLDRGILLAEASLSLTTIGSMILLALTRAVYNAQSHKSSSPFIDSIPDLMQYGTLLVAFLGASAATRSRRHLAIDALSRVLSDRSRRVVAGLASLFGAVVAYAFAYAQLGEINETLKQSLDKLADQAQYGITVDSDRWEPYFHYVIPGGFFMISARLVMHGFHEIMAAASPAIPDPVVTPRNEDVDPPPQGGPVEYASWIEIAIASVVLIGLFITFRQIHNNSLTSPIRSIWLLCVVLALGVVAMTLGLRWWKTRSLQPLEPLDPPAPVRASWIGAAVGVAVVVGFLFLANQLTQINVIKATSNRTAVFLFAGMALLGAPLFTFLGGLGLFLQWHAASIDPFHKVEFHSMVDSVFGKEFAVNSVMPTIPLFTLAGYLMSESKTPRRLVRVARAMLGSLPGGLAVVCVFASAFFTVFSGASGITIVAIGGLLFPALVKDKYPERFSLGLVTTGGALGITFYPCLPVIVYGIIAGLQPAGPGREQFDLSVFIKAGLLPGVVTLVMVSGYAFIQGAVSKVPRTKFDLGEAGAALWEAKWELLLPVFLVGGLAKGIFDPGSGAAFTAFYVLFIEVVIYRDLTIHRDVPRIVPESMILVGAIFVKLCAATVLAHYFINEKTADAFFEWLRCGKPAMDWKVAHNLDTCGEAIRQMDVAHLNTQGLIDSKITFLLALNFFLLMVGMLMDIFSAITVIVPLIMGIALNFGINQYHLGVIFLINLEIGYLMPPMGLNLFIASFRFNRPVPELYRTVLPFIAVFFGALMLVTYVPSLTLWLTPKSKNAPAAVATTEGNGGMPSVPVDNQPALLPDGGAAPVLSCDVPGDEENDEQFCKRCNFPEGFCDNVKRDPNYIPPNCDVPGDEENDEQFCKRCNYPEGFCDSVAKPDAGAASSAPVATPDASEAVPETVSEAVTTDAAQMSTDAAPAEMTSDAARSSSTHDAGSINHSDAHR